MTPDQIYTVLVDLCGATERDRGDFVWNFDRIREWRFQGRLGFGGKFYREREGLRVGCYPEDRTPERDAMVDMANRRLKEFHP